MKARRESWWAILILILAGCSGQDGSDARVTRPKTMAVIPKGTTHAFWQSVHAGAQQASKETGLDLVWVGPEKEDDRQQQIALFDNQVLKGVAGIVLAPLDAKALRRPVQAAVNHKIPVVIMDSNLDDSENLIVSFVATDNKEGGRMAARALAEAIGKQGKVTMLRYVEGSASTDHREAGFLEEIAKFSGIEVASSEQYGGPTTAQSQQVSETLLLRFTAPDGTLSIQGIFTCNESTTYGMLQALRRNQLAGKVKFVGFDTSPPLLEALKSREINGLVAQNPFKMGYVAVKTLSEHLEGKTVPKVVDTGAVLVTPENPNPPDGM